MTSLIPRSGRPGATTLGFGCNNLLGDKTRAEGIALLAAAYEAGVRHFDVARYYGYGDAEGLLADFLKGRRDQVTITTKFGIQPMKAARRLSGIVSLARRLMRASALVRKVVRRRVQSLVQHGMFDPVSAQNSLDTSLRELRSEYVDVFLMHEPTADDCTDALLEFASKARDAGKIRYFGTGAAFSRTVEIHKTAPQFTRVMQFESDLLNHNVKQITADLTITHGAIAPLTKLLEAFRADAFLAERASATMQCDMTDGGNVATALLLGAVLANPQGLVLFRSVSPSRIEQNVRAVTAARFAPEQLEKFSELYREIPHR